MKTLQSFFFGILAALGALFLEIAFLDVSQPFNIHEKNLFIKEFFTVNYTFFAAILIEEFLKFLVIYKTIAKDSKESNLAIKSIIFGIGFASIETAIILWNHSKGMLFDPIGLGGIIFIHISTSLLIAYFIGKNLNKNFIFSFSGLVLAIIIHSVYNIINVTEIGIAKKLIFGLFVILFIINLGILFISKKSTIIA